MDHYEENPQMRSNLPRPPSRIPSPGKGLTEISDSQGNARSKPASMLPPPSFKHRIESSCMSNKEQLAEDDTDLESRQRTST